MAKKINEEKIMGTLYANFRGRNKKINDWIYLAKQIKKLSKHYGSTKKVAENLGMSPETIRETLKLLELPEEVQLLVKENKLKHEIAWRIASIKDKKRQILIANEILGFNSHDGRDIVRICRKNPKLDIKEFISKFKKSKMKVEKINLIVLPIRKLDYDKIKRKAKKIQKNPEEYILDKIKGDILREN